MELMDQSLDDIIKMHKQQTKKRILPKSSFKASKPTALHKTRTPYGRPKYKEAPLFTETYKSWNAPVAAIFTSTYVPKTDSIKLVVYNDRASKEKDTNINSTAFSAGKVNGNRSSDTYRPYTEHNGYSRVGQRTFTGGDFYRPEPLGSRHNGSNNRRRNSHDASRSSSSYDRRDDKRPNYIRESASTSGTDNKDQRTHSNSNNNNNYSKGKDTYGDRTREARSVDNNKVSSTAKSMDVEMASIEVKQEEEEQAINIKGVAPIETDHVNGPVTIEIDNLDPETTAEDVKVVCSRFGEIKSCICANGYSQVTYARKAAGVAAMETLNGKKADNNQILRVKMLKTPIFHNVPTIPTTHVPSSIAGPMKILTKAVHGTITNAGSIYSNQLMLAQQFLKMQQHRVAQIQIAEQEMALRRIEGVTGSPVPTLPTLVSIRAMHDLPKIPVVEDLAGGLL
ncbi:hypothetical protein FBU30_008013 [Linnemannia zychae]|nr:hypothetical protein FBU30_008013 [Linnemannia zychae]